MRLAEFCGGADPARTDDKKNLGKNEIEQTERLFERLAARFDVLLRALEIDAPGNFGLWTLMFAVRFFRRWRDVAKLAVTNLPAGISNVTACAESAHTENNHGDDERR